MNDWTNKDMNILGFMAVMGLSMGLSLAFTLAPIADEHEDRLDIIEERLEIEND